MDASRSLPHPLPQPTSGPITPPDDLDALLAGLIAAANAEALSSFHVDTLDGRPYSVCDKCGFYQPEHGKNMHSATCRVGALLERIGALEEYFEGRRRGLPSAADLDAVAEERRAAEATRCPNDQADGFGEPWRRHVSGEYETVHRADGRTVVDMTGSELTEEDDMEYARRIPACVNFCVGLPTEALEGQRLIDFQPCSAEASANEAGEPVSIAGASPIPMDLNARLRASIGRVDAQIGGAQ